MVDIGSGPPLLLIPGVQGRWEWMGPAVDSLKDRCRVISFSLAGDPGSGRRFDPTRGFDNYVDQIEEALTYAGTDDVAVCGVSFGGLVALHWATRRPERTKALVLVSTPSPDFKPDCRIEWYLRAPRLLSPLFAAQSPFRLGPEIWRAFDGVADRARFTGRHLARIVRSPSSPTRMAERARLLAAMDFGEACGRVSAPTLVVTGEPGLDRVVPVAGTRSYADRISGARHATLTRTGHIGLVTKPERFADLVGQFVDETAGEALASAQISGPTSDEMMRRPAEASV
ncbi:MAG: alpha/beta hydrolase [Ilumatobacter sp.]|jgi:pimeloyl-ACP methyl ester carboxylesterase|nr:alpha/beta hydrolase [Ilumatobacter sp.]